MDGWTVSELEALVEEATVDAYGEAEQLTGLFTMIEQCLVLPFETEVLGTPVTVKKIDWTDDDRLVAVCHHGKERQRIGILELPLPTPPPEGAEWIAAYRYWAGA